MKVRFFSLFLTFFFTLNIQAQETFTSGLESLLGSRGLTGAGCGISILEEGTGKILFRHNSTAALVPASVLKTVTSSTALEVLGVNYTFTTAIGYTGETDKGSGILKGNLVVLGGGDPTLGSEYFPEYNNTDFLEKWTSEIAGLGIKSIEGDLIIDASVYTDEDVPGTWVWDDIANYYGAGASGMTAYDNRFRIFFRSGLAGESTRIVKTVPEIPGLELKNEVVASKVNRDNAYVFGSPWGGKRIIRGTIPENREEFPVKASLPDPAKFLGERLKTGLAGQGIILNGKILLQKADTTGFKRIYLQKSPSLPEIVKVLNHESVNLFAEHLLKHISFFRTGTGTTAGGTESVSKFWQGKGLDVSGMFLEDGSGLSHFNAISAYQVTWILNYMKSQSPCSSEFYASLPVAGKGTLSVFNPDDFPDECLHAKSGSMTRVRSYAGYLKTESGKELVFAMIFNNFSVSQSELTREIGKLLRLMRKQF